MSLLGNLRSIFAGSKVNLPSRFEYLREAISGTMSTFYMARDRSTKEIVGLKILDIEKTQALEARFGAIKKPREGEIALSLVHPHIVRTIEHGMSTDDEQFIVMEFLDGPGLNSLIVGAASSSMAAASSCFDRPPRPSPRCTRPATSTATSARATSWSTRTANRSS